MQTSFSSEFVAGVLIEVVGKALQVSTRLAQRLRDNRTRVQAAKDMIALMQDLNQLTPPVVEGLVEVYGPRCPKQVRIMFESPDFAEFARQYVHAYRVGLAVPARGTFKRYLTNIARLYLQPPAVNKVAAFTLGALDGALETLKGINERLASLLEIESTSPEFTIIVRQLEQLVRFWETHTRDKEEDLKDLVQRHRKQVAVTTRLITPPDFSERRRVPMEDIFVPPGFDGLYAQPIVCPT